MSSGVWQIFLAHLGRCGQYRGLCSRPLSEAHRGTDAQTRPRGYLAGMREQLETMLGRVADAINDARDGEIIAGSDWRPR